MIAMLKLLGPLPEDWWGKWKEGVSWYATEMREGGELAEHANGLLYTQILDVGLYDADYPKKLAKDEYIKDKDGGSTGDNTKGSTSRLIAMVGDLTTGKAADVISRVYKRSSDDTDEHKSDSASSGKVESGTGSGSGSGFGSGNKTDSGSGSGTNTGEKTTSSEEISNPVSKMTSGVNPYHSDQNENEIGDESHGAAGSVKLAAASALVRDFLEPEGTRITALEAHD